MNISYIIAAHAIRELRQRTPRTFSYIVIKFFIGVSLAEWLQWAENNENNVSICILIVYLWELITHVTER